MHGSHETLLNKTRSEYRNIIMHMSVDAIRWNIENVSDVLCDLREHLNTFAPVHRLPPELLSLIFNVATYIPNRHKEIFRFFVEVDEDAEPEFARARVPSSGVIAITHVCKRWRTVALQTPALWTYISAAPGSDQFCAYLERSLSLPLSIYLGAHIPALEATDLSSIGPRLHRLDLAIEDQEEMHFMQSILCIDAPAVRCATLISSPEWYTENSPDDVHWVDLFGRHDSSLEALAFELATHWLPSNAFSHLTHLLISCVTFQSPTLQSGLLSLLTSAPKLEFLHLIDLPVWYASDAENTPPVVLDGLRSLILDRFPWTTILPFCEQLIFPGDAPITLLDVESYASEVDPLQLPFLDHHSPVTTLEIYMERTTSQIIAKSSSRTFLLQWNGSHNSNIALTLHKLLSLSAVTSFTLSLGPHPSDAANLPDMLVHLSQVSEIEIHAKYPDPSYYDRGPPTGVLLVLGLDGVCPALSRFSLHLNGPATDDKALVIHAASEMLRQRAHKGAPLRQLVVQPYDRDPFSAREVENLRSKLAPYVQDFEVRKADTPVSRPSERPNRWMVEGAEKYWSLYEGAKPEYLGPYGRDLSEVWMTVADS